MTPEIRKAIDDVLINELAPRLKAAIDDALAKGADPADVLDYVKVVGRRAGSSGLTALQVEAYLVRSGKLP